MRRIPRLAVAAMLAVLAAGLAGSGCATARPIPENGALVIQPGDEFLWHDAQYRLVSIQEDFVVLKYVEPEGAKGEISGWVKEVFRIDRYELGQGRWNPRPELEGLSVMWKGGEDFALSASGGPGPGPAPGPAPEPSGGVK